VYPQDDENKPLCLKAFATPVERRLSREASIAAPVTSQALPTIWRSVAGRKKTLEPRAQGFRAETQRRHAAAQRAWDPASHPDWLDKNAYRTKVQPRLMQISTSRIATTLGVSWAYASVIRKSQKIPHPCHWRTLAQLVGFPPGE
jgi:hypothetical protein